MGIKTALVLFLTVPAVALGAVTQESLQFIESLVLILLRIIPFLFGIVLLFVLWEIVQIVLSFTFNKSEKVKLFWNLFWGFMTLGVIIVLWWLIYYLSSSF